VGAGLSGQWAAELLLETGAEVTVCDQKPASELNEALERFRGRPVKWVLGEKVAEAFKNVEPFHPERTEGPGRRG